MPTVQAPDPVSGGHHFVPVMQSPQLLSQASPPHMVFEGTKPMSFLVGTYTVQNLPAIIVFNGQNMRQSFKPNTYYTFVVAVFAKAMVSFVAFMDLNL